VFGDLDTRDRKRFWEAIDPKAPMAFATKWLARAAGKGITL
jgi:hypothetical protein